MSGNPQIRQDICLKNQNFLPVLSFKILVYNVKIKSPFALFAQSSSLSCSQMAAKA